MRDKNFKNNMNKVLKNIKKQWLLMLKNMEIQKIKNLYKKEN